MLGIDASREMISYAQEHFGVNAFPNLDFAMEDISKLAFQDEFDTVFSFNALHWIPDRAPALAAIYRVMREGGSAHLRWFPGVNAKAWKTCWKIRGPPRDGLLLLKIFMIPISTLQRRSTGR